MYLTDIEETLIAVERSAYLLAYLPVQSEALIAAEHSPSMDLTTGRQKLIAEVKSPTFYLTVHTSIFEKHLQMMDLTDEQVTLMVGVHSPLEDARHQTGLISVSHMAFLHCSSTLCQVAFLMSEVQLLLIHPQAVSTVKGKVAPTSWAMKFWSFVAQRLLTVPASS